MTLPVAGWYDDPEDAEQLRWWTGVAWSEARECREPVLPVAAEPALPDPVFPWATEPSLPLPYGPASVTGVAAASASAVDPAGPPPVPPFAAAAAVQVGTPAGPQLPVAMTGPGASPQAQAQPQPRKSNALALAGVFVGLLALAFNPAGVPGLLAVLFGILGLRRANDLKQSGAPVAGYGAAIAALVLGGIACTRLVGTIIGMVS